MAPDQNPKSFLRASFPGALLACLDCLPFRVAGVFEEGLYFRDTGSVLGGMKTGDDQVQ
jgi:hypothetical protein